MKIDELYFGYTPYSKYTLNEDENTDSSNDNSEESSTEKKNTKEKVNKNTKVNIAAYFNLTNEEISGQNSPKGFVEELEDLLNTPHVADSMAAKLKDSEGKIAEKDKEIEELTKQIEELENTADAILAAGANAQTELNNIKNPSTQKKDNGKHNNPNNDNPPGDNDMLNNIRGVGE
jgi:hypothetical protein